MLLGLGDGEDDGSSEEHHVDFDDAPPEPHVKIIGSQKHPYTAILKVVMLRKCGTWKKTLEIIIIPNTGKESLLLGRDVHFFKNLNLSIIYFVYQMLEYNPVMALF